ncbi:MAG TPA: type II secretion system protein [Kiritimatiellia bacterium]|nr:type II secretion system protein [Kiritimatiellia bacterium]HRZ13455.1 type II secretion system protein [Kiritimatiellia bacterium]HSA19667.1 type II secretion system protein [Kiritimatiellia bacterium]
MSNPFQRSRGAFSLTELLVLVAIAGILAALLVPALSRSRARARQLRCMGNVRQVAQGLLVVASGEMPRKLPYATDFGSLGGKTGRQAALGGRALAEERPLHQVLPDPEVFRCPADRGDAVLGVDSVFDAVGSSYLYPVKSVDGIAAAADEPVTGFPFPERKIIVFEPPLLLDRPLRDRRTGWHDARRVSVAGFLDGHAQMVESAGYTNGDPAHAYY